MKKDRIELTDSMESTDKNTDTRILFLEGPIQTGKSTLIRRMLKACRDRDLKIGGFTSQRLLDDEGNTIAFRIGAPRDSTAEQAEKYISAASSGNTEKLQTGNTEKMQEEYLHNGIFKYLGDDGRMHTVPGFFERQGTEILRKTLDGRYDIILLDEIGGHELACDEFSELLYRILDSGTPCIGVIKSLDNTEKMIGGSRRESKTVSCGRKTDESGLESESRRESKTGSCDRKTDELDPKSKADKKNRKAELTEKNRILHERILSIPKAEILYYDRIGEPETDIAAEKAIKEFLKGISTTEYEAASSKR